MKTIEEVRQDLNEMRNRNVYLQSVIEQENRLKKRYEYATTDIERKLIKEEIERLKIGKCISECDEIDKIYAEALNALTIEERSIIYMRYKQNLSIKTISYKLRCKYDNMRKQICRIIEKLQKAV